MKMMTLMHRQIIIYSNNVCRINSYNLFYVCQCKRHQVVCNLSTTDHQTEKLMQFPFPDTNRVTNCQYRLTTFADNIYSTNVVGYFIF
uniref:Uncharacterized protein n=1 Tax=Octopus bimaculoides TaxID=37653 RepID=A0A0L8H3E6_OCTBM